MKKLGSLKAFELRAELGGETISTRSTLFAVANTKYFGGGMKISPQANPTDGQLDLLVVADVKARTLARVLPTVFWGGHVSHKSVSQHTANSVKLETNSALWADGEMVASGPATKAEISVVGAALNLAH